MTAIAVDASAVIAVLNKEPEQRELSNVLIGALTIIGAPTLLEVHIWLRRRQDRLTAQWLEDWQGQTTTEVAPFDQELERTAAAAYDRYGKGLHEARLNFGDCMAYAVAKQRGLPLLFKGGDFGKTDVIVHQASVLSEL